MHLERFAGAEGLTTALILEPEAERDAAIDHVTEIIEPINPFKFSIRGSQSSLYSHFIAERK